jgi:IclR family pca regulon transcriptional regulator
VIRAFSSSDRRLTIADLSRSTGLTRAVVRRCVYTLSELGYVGAERNTYYLQPKVLHLGYTYLASTPLPIAAQPVLEDVSRALDESCSAGVLDEENVVCVARSASRRFLATTVGVGGRLPAYCTALGRVLLAHASGERVKDYFEHVEIKAYTKYTITGADALQKLLSSVREQGFAQNDQELEVGLRSIAVPVRNVVGDVVAAINVSAQASRVPRREMVERFLPVLQAGAERLESQLAAPR